MFKDLGNAESMIDYARAAIEQGAKATIDVADFAVISIHNEATDDVDYTNYLLIDKNGNKYYTGSESFWNSFKNIYNEMKDSEEEQTPIVEEEPVIIQIKEEKPEVELPKETVQHTEAVVFTEQEEVKAEEKVEQEVNLEVKADEDFLFLSLQGQSLFSQIL